MWLYAPMNGILIRSFARRAFDEQRVEDFHVHFDATIFKQTDVQRGSRCVRFHPSVLPRFMIPRIQVGEQPVANVHSVYVPRLPDFEFSTSASVPASVSRGQKKKPPSHGQPSMCPTESSQPSL